MAKKPKNKKPAVNVTLGDVSENNKETLTIPLPEEGREPTPGILPLSHPITSVTPEHVALNEGDKLIVGNSMRDMVGVLPESEETPPGNTEQDLRGQGAVDASITTDAIIGIQSNDGGSSTANELVGKIRELVPGAMEVNEDPVAKFEEAIVVEPRGTNTEPLQYGSKEFTGQPLTGNREITSSVLAEKHYVDTIEIGGTFKTDNLKKLVADECGFQVGKLYLFAFSADSKNAGDVSAWLDNNIEWSLPDQVDFYYFNQSSERAHVRNYREKSVRDRRIAIGILSVPSHCLMLTPHHIPHSMEADGVFAFSGTKLTREKYRGETSEMMDANREVTL